MEAYRISVIVVDFDEVGLDGVREAIELQRYPNDCIHPSCGRAESIDLGEWDDDHPLNMCGTDRDAWFDAAVKEAQMPKEVTDAD